MNEIYEASHTNETFMYEWDVTYKWGIHVWMRFMRLGVTFEWGIHIWMRFMRLHIWSRHSHMNEIYEASHMNETFTTRCRSPHQQNGAGTPELYVWVRGLTTRLSYEWVMSRKNERVISFIHECLIYMWRLIHTWMSHSYVTPHKFRHFTFGFPETIYSCGDSQRAYHTNESCHVWTNASHHMWNPHPTPFIGGGIYNAPFVWVNPFIYKRMPHVERWGAGVETHFQEI